ncbi:MAG: 16S rRNA (cytosine(967)-C(5))-methyltransferase RsmB [Syntrophobacteria bacterium]
MTPRAVAMHVLMQVARRASFPDALLDIYFKEHPKLDARDRALVTELVYGVLRWQGRLDWIIDQHVKVKPDKIALPVRVLLRLATYQLLFLDRIPPAAAVDEAVELSKVSQPQYIVRFVNGVLRTVARKREILKKADQQGDRAERLARRHSYPVWLVRRWLAEMGEEETEAFCAASNQIAPISIRANTLKTSPGALAAALRGIGFSLESGTWAPEALRLRGIRTDLSCLLPYQRGEFQVQDEASQLVGHLVDPKPGQRVLDACAGMGVKTTHLAQLMENRGVIRAVDRQGWKLNRLTENARRLQISCIEPLEADVLDLESCGGQDQFDRILLDAPCTGLGVLRRNPDIKWKVKPKDFYRLHLLQKQMLSRLAPLLRAGGALVYATCTVSAEENEATVRAFLSEHPDFYPDSASLRVAGMCEDGLGQAGMLRTLPHRHGIDGFFAVRLRRK